MFGFGNKKNKKKIEELFDEASEKYYDQDFDGAEEAVNKALPLAE